MKNISILLCLVWMGFIFYMSSNNGQISHEQSTTVASVIEETKSKLQAQAQSENKIANEKQTDRKAANVQVTSNSEVDYIVRKNAHAFLYMMLAFLVSASFFSYNKRGKNSIIYIMFICLFYAVTDEFHQAFVPDRTSSVSDVLVDFSGAIIGLVVFYLVYYKVYKKYLIKKR